MGYIEDIEKQNEELKEKLATSQLSYKTYKALITYLYENCNVTWDGDRSERNMIVKSSFRLSPKDVLSANGLPEAKELFEKFKMKADEHEKNNASF